LVVPQCLATWLIAMAVAASVFVMPDVASADPNRASVEQFAGQTISTIEVTGNRRVEPDTITANINATAGSEVDLEQISEDIHRVYELGYFEDITVRASAAGEGGVTLTFEVDEKPAIADITFKGNNKIDDDTLSDAISIEKYRILDTSKVKSSAEAIRKKYVKKGFYLAEVSHEVKPVEDQRDVVEVAFTIREFSKVQVKEINILGNDSIPEKRLERVMKTKEGNVLSLLSNAGNFNQEDFQADIQRLTYYYYDQGFVEVSVDLPSIRLSKDKQFLFITVRVDEGIQFDVGDVSVRGDLLESKEKLLDRTSLPDTTTFSWGQMQRDTKSLKNYYENQGYAFSQVRPLTRLNRQEQTVDVTFDITKGDKVRFGRIEVTGNQKTQDRVIRRELEITEGELYSNRDIKRSKQAIKRLGFFKQVQITTQKSGSDRVTATVKVTERRTGNFQVGAGFSSTESFIGNARISQDNLFGRGQSLSLQAQVSQVRTLFNLRFREPWLLGSRWNFTVNAFNFSYAYQDFSRRSTGGDVSFGYPISEALELDIPGRLEVSGTYKLERVDIQTQGRGGGQLSRPGNFFSGGLTSSLAGSVNYDTRNNRLFPTDGQYHKATLEVADQFTASQTEFAKFDWDSRVYIPLVWEFVLRLNGEVGYIQSLSADRPVPLFERYFVGGPRTVRGYQRYTLGPSRAVAASGGDPASTLSDYNIGGNKQILLTSEIEFPILASAGLKGVFFADAGNAFNNNQPFTLALDLFKDGTDNYQHALRTAVGAGLRWRSPFGPLRFEWGFPLKRVRGEQPVVFEFSIGNAF
jgi:outer membrane protein insertion porin family